MLCVQIRQRRILGRRLHNSCSEAVLPCIASTCPLARILRRAEVSARTDLALPTVRAGSLRAYLTLLRGHDASRSLPRNVRGLPQSWDCGLRLEKLRWSASWRSRHFATAIFYPRIFKEVRRPPIEIEIRQYIWIHPSAIASRFVCICIYRTTISIFRCRVTIFQG